MSRERRLSVTSSVVSDVSCLPTITEDEISGMSLEQLECAAEELHNLCSVLQAEVDLYSRYLSSQVAPDNTALTPASLSGSGTATPTLSSLDVRGLWHGQVITRSRTQQRIKLSDKEKSRLWQRELEIVLANQRKQERVWKQQLHKYQVSSLEAETQRAAIMKAQQELMRLATGYESGALDTYNVRINFPQLLGFMEDHIRKGLKQVSQVWVQVTVLKSELAKLKPRLEGKNGVLDIDLDSTAASQVTYLKKQLEHEEVKTRLEDNSRDLGQLRLKLEAKRRKANRLEDENKKSKTHLEDLKSQAEVLEEELNRLEATYTRINSHLHQADTRMERRTKVLSKGKKQVMTVREYLQLGAEVDKLKKEVQRWKGKTNSVVY